MAVVSGKTVSEDLKRIRKVKPSGLVSSALEKLG